LKSRGKGGLQGRLLHALPTDGGKKGLGGREKDSRGGSGNKPKSSGEGRCGRNSRGGWRTVTGNTQHKSLLPGTRELLTNVKRKWGKGGSRAWQSVLK